MNRYLYPTFERPISKYTDIQLGDRVKMVGGGSKIYIVYEIVAGFYHIAAEGDDVSTVAGWMNYTKEQLRKIHE